MTQTMDVNGKKHFWLYVLKLEQGKYYIGITSQTPEQRFKQHLGARKAHWTETYPPISIFDRKDLGDSSLEEAKRIENLVTRRYIKERGINNVRGGDLMQVSNYSVRFGYIFDELNYYAFTVAALEFILLVLMAVLYAIKK
jgi:predicted GIY-YIG superfamily endonuclease